ncbi:MAG: diguanylate cyclase [Candidatus Latescibacterota bacterium]
MRILIAEDDLTSRTILKVVLKKHGHEVVETVNGLEAWNVMQQPDAPQMAILDWMMPRLDGLEVCRRIRSLKTDQPPYLIMLTSKGEKADIIAGFEAGADDYLAKPFDPGEFRARIGVGRRMIEIQKKLLDARNTLEHMAMHDQLTGIYNRRAISDALSRELSIEQRHHNGLAVGICDIDHFKKVNDIYGHQVGDEVLCGFVQHMGNILRKYDYLGRWGGEEFVIISTGITENDITILFERLRAVVADNPIPTKAGDVFITVSIGVKIWKENETLDTLLAAADSALYQAKSQGRNRVYLTDELIEEDKER